MCRIMFRSFNSYEMKIKANASGTNLDTFSHVCQPFLSVMLRWLQRPVSDEQTPRPEPPEPLTFRPMMSKTSPSYITELRGYNSEEQNANVKKVGQNFKKNAAHTTPSSTPRFYPGMKWLNTSITPASPPPVHSYMTARMTEGEHVAQPTHFHPRWEKNSCQSSG